jgi:hypothetical protein
VLDELGVVNALDPDPAARGAPGAATDPLAVRRGAAGAAAGRTSVTGVPSSRNPPGFRVNWRRLPVRSRSVTAPALTWTTSPQNPLARSSTTSPGRAGTAG